MSEVPDVVLLNIKQNGRNSGEFVLGISPQTVPICESELLVALGSSDLEHWVSHTRS